MERQAHSEHCECENLDRGLFVWRGDREWWSCGQCDQRVRPLTDAEKREREAREADAMRAKAERLDRATARFGSSRTRCF